MASENDIRSIGEILDLMTELEKKYGGILGIGQALDTEIIDDRDRETYLRIINSELKALGSEERR